VAVAGELLCRVVNFQGSEGWTLVSGVASSVIMNVDFSMYIAASHMYLLLDCTYFFGSMSELHHYSAHCEALRHLCPLLRREQWFEPGIDTLWPSGLTLCITKHKILPILVFHRGSVFTVVGLFTNRLQQCTSLIHDAAHGRSFFTRITNALKATHLQGC
jgi:hypothetical protein